MGIASFHPSLRAIAFAFRLRLGGCGRGAQSKCERWESWRLAPRWAAVRRVRQRLHLLTSRLSWISNIPAASSPKRPGSISARAATLSGVQDQKRTNDGLATAAAVVIFWPAAFFVGGDKQTAAELAQMKGQMVAIEQASIQKKMSHPVSRQAAGHVMNQTAWLLTESEDSSV